MKEQKKQIIFMIIAISFILILVIGASFAYFQIITNENLLTTNTTGSTDLMPKGAIVTNIGMLKLNITAEMMHKEKEGTTYYATEDGIPVTSATEGSGRYTLATISLLNDAYPAQCTYVFDISATTSKEINDGSDADVIVKIIETNGKENNYTLTQLLKGITHTGIIKNLTYEQNQKIKIEAYVINTGSVQNDLSGNTIAITIAPKEQKEGFSCEIYKSFLAAELIESGALWQSGLEDDGYRYTGTGILCSYDEGKFLAPADNQYTTPGCSKKYYNYIRTTISNGQTNKFTYQSSCPSDNDTYTYSCTEVTGTIMESSKNTVPNNFICFGTTDKTECKNNEKKYMYRMIGIFPGSEGNQHLKLIKFNSLGYYKWNSIDIDVDWQSSTLYTSLNGSSFLTSTTYDYMQNSTWLNKIENWQWIALNTMTETKKGLDYQHGASIKDLYLHEMNRSTKSSNIGMWTNVNAKIGLMYASDYVLSLGNQALLLTGNTSKNAGVLHNGWLYSMNNNATNQVNWTISRYDYSTSMGKYRAWMVYTDGRVDDYPVTHNAEVRPTFYLTSNVEYKSGSGKYDDPYILLP